MKKAHLIIIILVVSIVSTNCTREPPVVFTVKIESTDREVVTETRDILLRRYNEFLPSRFSKIHTTIEGPLIKFVVSNGAPAKRVIGYLTESPGILEAFHIKNKIKRVWFTDQDLVSASVFPEKRRNMLNIKISSQAGTRATRLSRSNVGEQLTIEIDGRTVAEGRIFDTLTSSFVIHVPNHQHAQEISVILIHGRLPAVVKLESWKNEL